MEDWTALQAGAFITGWAYVISLIGQFPHSTRCPSARGVGWGGLAHLRFVPQCSQYLLVNLSCPALSALTWAFIWPLLSSSSELTTPASAPHATVLFLEEENRGVVSEKSRWGRFFRGWSETFPLDFASKRMRKRLVPSF